MELMLHNKLAVEEILEGFKTCSSIAYIAGTGLGKSFVFMAIAKSIKGRILYVYPKHAIGENIQTYSDFKDVAEYVDFTTYNSFGNYDKIRESISQYSMVIFDECHHLFSDIYGKNACRCIEEFKVVKFLGLTATPCVGENSITSLFKKTVNGLSIIEAIETGLMPVIDYEIPIPKFSDSLLQSLSFNKVKTEIDIVESAPLLRSMINKADVDKWICFFPDFDSMIDKALDIQALFKDYSVIPIVSRMPNSRQMIRYANESKKIVLLTCTMLTEGIHLDGINGIMLFRNVESINLFTQIIGRVCHVGQKKSPKVIDCSKSAYKLLYSFTKYFEKSETSRISMSSNNKLPVDFLKVSVNGTRELSKEDLFEILKKSSSDEFSYNGVDYASLNHACTVNEIDYDEVIKYMQIYKISKVQAFQSLISKHKFIPCDD